MYKILLIILVTAILPLHAQRFTEFGVFGGGTAFIGDVGTSEMFPSEGWVFGGTIRHQIGGHYAVRLHFAKGMVYGDDANSNQRYKIDRNLSFRSPVTEVAILIEFNYIEYITGSKKDRYTPYLFGGLGIFNYNPQGKYHDGEWYDLQPLGTEGQATSQNASARYGLSGVSIPFGLGYRISIANNMSIALESGMRLTSTDYFDDVSGFYANSGLLARESGDLAAWFSDRSISDSDKTGYARGQSNRNDVYIFTGIHIYFAIQSRNERCSRF